MQLTHNHTEAYRAAIFGAPVPLGTAFGDSVMHRAEIRVTYWTTLDEATAALGTFRGVVDHYTYCTDYGPREPITRLADNDGEIARIDDPRLPSGMAQVPCYPFDE